MCVWMVFNNKQFSVQSISIGKVTTPGSWRRVYNTQYTLRAALTSTSIWDYLNPTFTTYWKLNNNKSWTISKSLKRNTNSKQSNTALQINEGRTRCLGGEHPLLITGPWNFLSQSQILPFSKYQGALKVIRTRNRIRYLSQQRMITHPMNLILLLSVWRFVLLCFKFAFRLMDLGYGSWFLIVIFLLNMSFVCSL